MPNALDDLDATAVRTMNKRVDEKYSYRAYKIRELEVMRRWRRNHQYESESKTLKQARARVIPNERKFKDEAFLKVI